MGGAEERGPARKSVGQHCTFDPRLFSVFRAKGGAVGVFATHIDGILGCGESDVLAKMRVLLERCFGGLKLQESSFDHVGMELAQDHTFSVTLTQGDFATDLQPFLTTPKLRAARQKLLSPEGGHMCQCKLGELRWLATVSRPDICARLALVVSRIYSLQGSHVHWINDLI